MRMKVDLPQPDGPMMETNSRRWMSSETLIEDDVLMTRGTKGLLKISHGQHHGAFPDAPEAGGDLRVLLVVVRELE